MYCQSCGAQNAEDARFCNKCGARIAAAGQPGGPVANEAAPGGGANVWQQHEVPASPTGSLQAPLGYMPQPGSGSTASISLQAIGVQSRGRTWGVIVGIAIALVALGAGGAWLAMRGGDPEPAGTENAAPVLPPPEGPIEIGTPLPVGVEAPDVVATTKVRTGTGTGAGTATGTGTGTATARTPTGARAGTKGRTKVAGGAASGSGSAEGTGGGAETGTETAAGTEAGTGTGTETGAGTGAETGTGSGTDPGGDPGEEQDVEMTMYAAHVRRFIRTFYATRAQSCFEHASRNDQNVRGTVSIAFTIGGSGQVSQAEVQRNSTANEALGRCLATQVRGWRLPAPPRGEPVELAMPFSR